LQSLTTQLFLLKTSTWQSASTIEKKMMFAYNVQNYIAVLKKRS